MARKNIRVAFPKQSKQFRWMYYPRAEFVKFEKGVFEEVKHSHPEYCPELVSGSFVRLLFY
jgi:hypothetical protein